VAIIKFSLKARISATIVYIIYVQKSFLKASKKIVLWKSQVFWKFHGSTLNHQTFSGVQYWYQKGLEDLTKAGHIFAKLTGQSHDEAMKAAKRPKNVVIFIGDGMSLATVTAARIYKGQKLNGVSGEEQYLSWEESSDMALLKVQKWPKLHKTLILVTRGLLCFAPRFHGKISIFKKIPVLFGYLCSASNLESACNFGGLGPLLWP
jgi:hypothetical protein